MKSKKINYLLGLLVLIIWGAIIYRVVAATSEDNELPPPETRPREAYDDHALTQDTAQLRAGYRDPFGQLKPVDTTTISVKRIIRPHISMPVARPLVDWNAISYRGFIRNPGSKKLIAILIVNGRPVMLAEGESSGTVKLLRNLRDSVNVSYQGHHKFLTINPTAL